MKTTVTYVYGTTEEFECFPVMEYVNAVAFHPDGALTMGGSQREVIIPLHNIARIEVTP